MISLLEDFVNTKNLPPSLPDHEAEALIAARVQQIQEQHDAHKAQEHSDAINRLRVELLIQMGCNAAASSTLFWDSRDAEEARAEVARELQRCVGPDWTAVDVRRRVEAILGGWEEEDEEGDEAEEEDEADDEGEKDDDEADW